MSIVSFTLREDVALIQMDDGKANVLSHAMIDALTEALDRAAREAKAAVLAGRDGLFCGGFDLAPMTAGPDSARALVKAGSELNLQIILHPQPLVVACTGHALAAGALLLLSGDTRIGAAGKFKIGLNEVAIGLRLPVFAVELARDRLNPKYLLNATVQSGLCDPERAREIGYLDQLAPPDQVVETAVTTARALTQLNRDALAATKKMLRGPMVERVRATLDADLADLDISQVEPRG